MAKSRKVRLSKPDLPKIQQPLDRDELPSDQANPSPIPEAPDSSLSRTAPLIEDIAIQGDLNLVNLVESEKRIGLLSRIILEASLRAPRSTLTLREKADIALRAISVLEGSKAQVTWKEELLKKPTPKTVEQYEAERAQRERSLTDLLLRSKTIRAAQVEEALKELGEKDIPQDEVQ